MDAARLAQIEALLVEVGKRESKATPGPWRVCTGGDQIWPEWDWPKHTNTAAQNMEKQVALCSRSVSDTRFIASARSDIPALLSALRDLLAEMPRWIAVTPSTMPDIGTEVLVMDRGWKDLGPDIVVIVVRNVINAANNADYNDFSLRHLLPLYNSRSILG